MSPVRNTIPGFLMVAVSPPNTHISQMVSLYNPFLCESIMAPLCETCNVHITFLHIMSLMLLCGKLRRMKLLFIRFYPFSCYSPSLRSVYYHPAHAKAQAYRSHAVRELYVWVWKVFQRYNSRTRLISV